jgi:hypothetical protein
VPFSLHRDIAASGQAFGLFSDTDDSRRAARLAELFGPASFASVLLADEPDGAYKAPLGRTP